MKNKLKARLAHEGIQLENYEIKGLPIRWFNPKNTFAAERVILVGDAAGVDPTYGEGISFALGYGELAAAEICQAYVKNEFSFSGYKKRILSHPMGRSLKRRLRLARMLYRFSNRKLQRFIWWRLGFILKWYIDNFLFDWAKYDELPTDSKKGNSVNL